MSDGTGLPGDPHRAPCERCPDGHTDPRTKPWGARLDECGEMMRGDGAYSGVRVERSDGGHVAQADADWLWWLTKMAPLVSGEHWPKTVREHEVQDRLGVHVVVTCACGHQAHLYGPAQLQVWYHAHSLWPTLTAAELAVLLGNALHGVA